MNTVWKERVSVKRTRCSICYKHKDTRQYFKVDGKIKCVKCRFKEICAEMPKIREMINIGENK